MTLTCPMCGGTEFDRGKHVIQGRYAGRAKYCREYVLFPAWSGLAVRARACLACGHIAMFVEDLKTLREQAEANP